MHPLLSLKWDSNPRPTHYECVALPTELFKHFDEYSIFFDKKQVFFDGVGAIFVKVSMIGYAFS